MQAASRRCIFRKCDVVSNEPLTPSVKALLRSLR